MSFSLELHLFVFICVLVGIVFVISGRLFKKYPPKHNNLWYGYRTPSSKKSQERWDFAQIYSASELIKTGLILMLIGLAGLFCSVEPLISLLAGITVVIISCIVVIYRVERALIKKF